MWTDFIPSLTWMRHSRPCQNLMDMHTITRTCTRTHSHVQGLTCILTHKGHSLITMNPSSRTTKAGSVFWQRHKEETRPTFSPFVAQSHSCMCETSPTPLLAVITRPFVPAQTSLSALFVEMRPDCMQMICDASFALIAALKDNREDALSCFTPFI